MIALQYILLGLAAGSAFCAFALSIKPMENVIAAAGCLIAVSILEIAAAIRKK